uniref:Secreted protein n=1 Tax=Anguilla anguilla TaxID=7936 RepID=A0A0E9WUF4_ANGAN
MLVCLLSSFFAGSLFNSLTKPNRRKDRETMKPASPSFSLSRSHEPLVIFFRPTNHLIHRPVRLFCSISCCSAKFSC